MSALKIIKKHNHHLNNPFPSNPKSLSFKQGSLLLHSHIALSNHQIFPIGTHFQFIWRSENGGYVSISHISQPTRSIWSTVPGQPFISTAMAETEIQESRGSFVIKDRNVRVLCNHQTIEDINVSRVNDQDYASGCVEFGSEFPVLEMTGRVFSMMKNKTVSNREEWYSLEKYAHSYVKYKLLFVQKNNNQIGFQIKLGKRNLVSSSKLSPTIYKGFLRKLTWTRRIRVRLFGSFIKRKRVVMDSGDKEEIVAVKDGGNECFNRICFTYSSEKDERFFGFGEQFSHLDFKGRKVPIFVQEQGIGRGDQPITFAANLVSYRAGGDWSTTYAPSPFYMTSKMKSLYLEGYEYSVFDLTEDDRVQIQHKLIAYKPSELIEQFTRINRETTCTS